MAAEPSFEWDEARSRLNEEKHGVASEMAQLAFLDEHRIIAEDLGHSTQEQRFYCFGKVDEGILRCGSLGGKAESAFLAPAIGAKVRGSMSERTRKYTKGEIAEVRVIEDFLPPPADLVLREDTVKVTLALSRRSVDFFKEEAGKARVPYQRMIRALVDAYTKRAGGKAGRRAPARRARGE